MTHWAVQYLGKRWSQGACGPDTFDCWGFVRHVQREHFSIEVPVITVDASDLRAVLRAFSASDELRNWVAVQTPQDGDAVLLSSAKYPAHCGVYVSVDGGGVIHCNQSSGVIFQSLQSLKHHGWGKLEFYRHITKRHG